MPTRPAPRSRGSLTALLLGMALLLAQALGLAHRVAHADGPPLPRLQASAGHDHAAEAHDATPFDGHEDRSDCRLYDQLQLADALGLTLPLIADLAADGVTPSVRLDRLALAPPQGYQARGPPLG